MKYGEYLLHLSLEYCNMYIVFPLLGNGTYSCRNKYADNRGISVSTKRRPRHASATIEKCHCC
jgi:hypothetical protein